MNYYSLIHYIIELPNKPWHIIISIIEFTIILLTRIRSYKWSYLSLWSWRTYNFLFYPSLVVYHYIWIHYINPSLNATNWWKIKTQFILFILRTENVVQEYTARVEFLEIPPRCKWNIERGGWIPFFENFYGCHNKVALESSHNINRLMVKIGDLEF